MAFARIDPIPSTGVAMGSLLPMAPSVSISKINIVLVSTTCYGNKVAIKPKTEEQAKRLVDLYRKIFPVSEDLRHCEFHLNNLETDINGQKSYQFSSDDTIVKELRKLAEEITGYSDISWDVYSSGSRVAENAPMSLVRNEIPQNYNKANLTSDPEINSEMDRVHKKLDESRNLLAELAKDLQDIDRKKKIQAAQEKLNQVQDDAVAFACAYKDKDLSTRWKEAKEKLCIDLYKDRNYLEDVVRLTCKNRAEYVQESKQLEDLEKFPMPNPPSPSKWQKIQSWFSGKREEPVSIGAGAHRSDSMEFFFVRLIEDENVEQLLDSSLFVKAFSDLHPVDLDALRVKFKEANKEVFHECEELSEEPSIKGPSSNSYTQDTAIGPDIDDASDEEDVFFDARSEQ
jgi:hypothetical protein